MPGIASVWSTMDDSLAINPKALIKTWSFLAGEMLKPYRYSQSATDEE